MNKEVILIGASGHSKVIADIIKKNHDIVYGYLDDAPLLDSSLNILGKTEDFYKYRDKDFIIAIGNNKIRKIISEKCGNIKYYTAIHPSAVISDKVTVGEGSCIMAGAVINENVKIGKHCIINTNATIEHDDIIDDYVHISPRTVLCGNVKIGTRTHVGAGATIINNISITSECIIGAGATVVKDINTTGTYVGVPAKKVK